MSSLLPTLFAVLDCHAWSHGRAVQWADRWVSELNCPKGWLADLSISDSADAALEAVRTAMRESGVVLPDNVGDLMAGLILLRFDSGELSVGAARARLVDIVDAYGASTVDAEAAGVLDLDDEVLSGFRARAEGALRRLANEGLLEADRLMMED